MKHPSAAAIAAAAAAGCGPASHVRAFQIVSPDGGGGGDRGQQPRWFEIIVCARAKAGNYSTASGPSAVPCYEAMIGYYQKDWRSLTAEQEGRASRLIWETGKGGLASGNFPFGPNRLGHRVIETSLFSLSPRQGRLPFFFYRGMWPARFTERVLLQSGTSLPAANEQYTPIVFF